MHVSERPRMESIPDPSSIQATGSSGQIAERVRNGWSPPINGPVFPNTALSTATAHETHTTTNFRIGICNEGKLSRAKLHNMQCWASQHTDVLLISEGAWRYRSVLDDKGVTFVAPLSQAWGGVGVMCNSSRLPKPRVKFVQSEKHFSIAVLPLNPTTAIIGAYITPAATLDANLVADMLSQLSLYTSKYVHVFLGGDFNSRTGSASRNTLDLWALHNGFQCRVPFTTHLGAPGGVATDIDLVFTKNIQATLSHIEAPLIGHMRLIFTIQTQPVALYVDPPKINWKELSSRSDAYNDEVSSLIDSGYEPSAALVQAGAKILGNNTPKPRRIPNSVRKAVRRLRHRLKNLERGSEEYRLCLEDINKIFNKYCNKKWKRLLSKIRDEAGLDKDAWKIIRSLSRPPQQQHVGPPTHEVVETIHNIYNSNQTLRSDWTLPEPIPMDVAPLDAPFELQELQTAIKQLPHGKAAGSDLIPYEAFAACVQNRAFLSELLAHYNSSLFGGFNIELIAKIITIPKAGGSGIRPLTLLPSTHKLLEKLIMNRLSPFQSLLHESQSGFRKGMSPLRSLLAIHLRILAREENRVLFIRTYDVEKAFDSVPKSYIASRFYDFMAPHAPLLARLAHDMLLANISTDIDGVPIMLKTGAPQGGIMSPLAYIISENPLCQILDHRLIKFADDNTLLCSSREELEQAERILMQHYAYSGCRINPEKTACLVIDGATTPTPIKILGAEVGIHGVELRATRQQFRSQWGWIASIAKANGLTTHQCLTVARMKCWASISYSLAVSLPAQRMLCYAWWELCRNCLHTYPTASTLKVVEAIGILHNPLWWSIESVIRFYKRAFQDSYLSNLLNENDNLHGSSLGRTVEAYIKTSGILWRDIRGPESTKQLLHRASIHFTSWMIGELEREGQRTGVTPVANPRLRPALYLRDKNGRYGFLFSLPHLGPTNLVPANCFFCDATNKDTGQHLMHECAAVSRPTLSNQAWCLEDTCARSEIQNALIWMKNIWSRRITIWESRNKPVTSQQPTKPRSTFLLGPTLRDESRTTPTTQQPATQRRRRPLPEGAADGPAPRRRRTTNHSTPNPHGLLQPSTETPNANVHSTGNYQPTDQNQPVSTAARIHRIGKWSSQEDDLLITALQQRIPPADLILTRDARQIKSRLNTKAFQHKLATQEANIVPTPPRRLLSSAELEELGSTMITRSASMALRHRRAREENDAGESEPRRRRTNEDNNSLLQLTIPQSEFTAPTGVSPPSTAAPVTAAPPRRRWTARDLEDLELAINQAGSPHDYRGVQFFLPSRTMPSITAKINRLFESRKISSVDGLYKIAHD